MDDIDLEVQAGIINVNLDTPFLFLNRFKGDVDHFCFRVIAPSPVLLNLDILKSKLILEGPDFIYHDLIITKLIWLYYRCSVEQQTEFDSEEMCSICLEFLDVHERNVTMVTPCQHVFHLNCLLSWLQTQRICPMCRYRIRTITQDMKLLIPDLEDYLSDINPDTVAKLKHTVDSEDIITIA